MERGSGHLWCPVHGKELVDALGGVGLETDEYVGDVVLGVDVVLDAGGHDGLGDGQVLAGLVVANPTEIVPTLRNYP